MKRAASFRPEDIRNIVLLGPSGSGKTTLAEALLHRTGVITRMGNVEDATTMSDFEAEARAHHFSTSSSALFATFEGREINVLDTPGHPELIGCALSVLPAVETALIVVDAERGIDFHARRLFHAAGDAGLSRMIAINKIDQNMSALSGLLTQLKATFGKAVHAINLPTKQCRDVIDCFDREAGDAHFGDVADIHKEMLESTVEIDDATLERYLSGEPIDLVSLRKCFVRAMNDGHVIPVCFTSAKEEVGVDDLLHILVEEGPSPSTARARRLRRGEEIIEVRCSADAPLLAHVFKVASDPYAGRIALLRILQGQLDASTSFICAGDKKPRKAGQVLKVEGREHPDLETVAYAGDIVALAKIEELKVDQILTSPSTPYEYSAIVPRYPASMLSLAVTASSKNDDTKLGSALVRLCEEDRTLETHHDLETREFVLSGQGELHLRLALEKLKNRFNVSVQTKPPKVAYRETIAARADGHYRLKKQTGGAGQFAEVFLRIEPLPRGAGFVFSNDVFGGTIPTQFMSAVEKGVEDALRAGPLAGFPVQDLMVSVYEGKSHPVDSKDIAFRTAAKMAVRDALSRARPLLLEPFVTMEIAVPEAHTGAVTTDLRAMRGRVIGIDTGDDGTTVVHAQAPLAEMRGYGTRLNGATAGQGSFVMELAHYDAVPPQIQQRLAAEHTPTPDE